MDTTLRRIVYEPDASHEEVWSVMRAAYLAQDGLSIAEAVKLLARRMSLLSEADLSHWKRMGKHNVKHPMMANEFVAQITFEWIKVYADMDHAGDVRYDECSWT